MGDVFPLDRRRGKASVGEQTQKTHQRDHHSDQAKILRHEQAAQDDDRQQLQSNLSGLRHPGDEAARNRLALEIDQQILWCELRRISVTVRQRTVFRH
jgi:hypothetical protein